MQEESPEEVFSCLYCDSSKPVSESSLEHAIPQFMGGRCAPNKFHLRNVCKVCNNRLGLFVDASYAKSWFVTNAMSLGASELYAGNDDPPIPLICMGLTNVPGIILPIVEEGELPYVIESWLGPSGESIFWIRPHDEKVASYAGGNPISRRKEESTAYLFLVGHGNVQKRFEMVGRSFIEAFKGKKIRKILCANIIDAEGKAIEFAEFQNPTDIEAKNAELFRQTIATRLRNRIPVDDKFDHRFISKMSLAIGYSLFGKEYLETTNAIEARKGCWPFEEEIPGVMGVSSLSSINDRLFSITSGYPGAITVMVMKVGPAYSMAVSVNQSISFRVTLAPASLVSQWVEPAEGYMLLLFPQLNKAIETSVANFLAHTSGGATHPELAEVDRKSREATAFRESLSHSP